MNAAALVADLRARGVTLRPDGDRLRVRPAEALTPQELETLRRHKAEVLALLAPGVEPRSAAPASGPGVPRVDLARLALDPETVREALGDAPDPHGLAGIRLALLVAVGELEAEIDSGAIAPGPRLVCGRPLADWLDLDDLARLLRAWRDHAPRATVDIGPWPDALPDLGRRTVGGFESCGDCGRGSRARYSAVALCLVCARRRERGGGAP